jgi:ATP-binding cassette, subfamily B, bacterial
MSGSAEAPRPRLAARLIDADLRRALTFVVPYWRRLALVAVISVASTALTLYLPLLSRDFFDRALVARDAGYLMRVAAAFAGATALSFILNVISGLRYTRVSAEILFDMRLAMYRHLQRLSPRFYARLRMGDIISRINNDIGEIQRVAAEVSLAWVGNGLFLIGTTAMLAWLDLRLFALTAFTAPLALVALVYYRGRLEREIAVMRDRSADIGSFLIETIQAMRLVVTANAQTREAERFGDKNQSFIRALMSMQRLSYLSGGLPGLVLSAVTGAVFVYGGLRVIDGTLTVGTFIAFMAYKMRFMPALEGLMGLYTSIATARVSLRRVSEILDTAPEVEESALPATLDAIRGEIVFDNVTLSFGRGGPVLDRLSFRVAPGEVLAIVGPSGSGKSTIADLIVRLLDPDSGVVRLDGHDIRNLRLDDLRQAVAVVDQLPCILHASIADNIRYARPDATDEEVAAAATAAALGDFINGLPEGYRTIVGERGAALSVGERQRVATARALLTNPAILVLDEPTASLDPVTERDVLSGLETVMSGRTTIVITHRLEVANRADRVLVLDQAQVVEEGVPNALAAQSSRFADLFGHAVA